MSTVEHPTRVEVHSLRIARVARVVLLAGTDAVMLIAAWTVAYLVWARPVHSQPASMYFQLAPLLVLFLLGYAQAGLYPGFGIGPVESLRRVSSVTFFGFLVLASASFVVKLPQVYSRMTFGLAYVFSAIAIPCARFVLSRRMRRYAWWSEPVVVVGSGPRVGKAIASLRDSIHLGYRAVALLSQESDGRIGREVVGVPVLGPLQRAAELARQGIRIAILEIEETDAEELDLVQQHFRQVVMLRDFGDTPVEGVVARNLGRLVGIEYTNNLLKWHNRAIKRLLDIVVGTFALLISLPIMALAALAVKLASPGPVLYRQERAGLHGSRLRVAKIRTMRPDAEERLEEYLAGAPHLRQEWDLRHKLKSDPRLIPRIGPWLRRWSVDELPQLWGVITGELSLVGPRPLPAYHLNGFPPHFLALRQRVRPGITGMWQVTVRAEGNPAEQEAFDTYYIRNWSIWLDLYLLARTVSAVWSGRGAY